MRFDIASYDGRPALVLARDDDGRANVRVFATSADETDEFYNGVELDQADDQPAADPEPPTEPANPSLPPQQ